MSIKFSVILPIYWKNEFNEFKKTFLSIINQTLKPNEIVIIFDGKVNSQKLKLPSGKILKGKERKIFETEKIKLDVLKSEKIIGLN